MNRNTDITRCPWLGAWAGAEDPIYRDYHDQEWGVPVRDERLLFEMLTLEGAQAGLSWITVLRKRENYRQAFHNFDIEQIACYTDADVARLMANQGIVRNRLKITSTIDNARAWLTQKERHGDCVEFLWSFVPNGQPLQPRRKSMSEIPASTPESDAMSKALKKLGFRFVGTTICYAFMQATGMVNDHTIECFRHAELSKTTRR